MARRKKDTRRLVAYAPNVSRRLVTLHWLEATANRRLEAYEEEWLQALWDDIESQ